MDTLRQDLRHALRALGKSPGFTAVAVLTLALGIGVNTAVFSLVDAALLKSLPYRDAGELVHLWCTNGAGGQHEASYPDFQDWRAQSTHLASLAGYQAGIPGSLRLADDTAPVTIGRATASFFPTLGVTPALGRSFTEEEERPGSEPVAVVTHELFTGRLGSDVRALGQPVVVNGTSWRLIGVLPPGFHFASGGADVWMALRPGAQSASRRNLWWVKVIGRLKPDTTLADALTEMTTIAARLEKAYPESNAKLGIRMVPLKEEFVGRIRPILLALLLAGTFVLLIAAANVANLLLSRGTTRRKELAIRVALGASRGRLVRQALTESLLLCAAGGGLGLLVSRWGVDLLRSGVPAATLAFMPALRDVPLHGGILAFTVLVSVLTGVVSGLAAALLAGRSDPQDALKGTVDLPAGPRRFRAADVFVVAEIALALTLLSSAGLMLRSARALLVVDPGFDPRNLLTVTLLLPERVKDGPARVAYHEELLKRARAIPGAVSAATTDNLPLGGGNSTANLIVDGQPPPAPGHELEARVRTVSPTYFHDLRIPLGAGRAFGTDDTAQGPNVVIVNRSFEKAFLSGAPATGKRLRFTYDSKQPFREIVGVVGDENQDSLDSPPRPIVYSPFAQDPARYMSLVVRTASTPGLLSETFRRELHAFDPDLLVQRVVSMDGIIDASPAAFRRRYPARVIGAFATAALFLAALGLYGVLAQSVAARRREVGIRMAVGARPSDVLRLVLGRGAWLTAAGAALGLAASAAASRALAALLFGVSPHDTLTLAGAVALVSAGALLASVLPARRALRVDPVVALRDE